jgi:hypothetical protein
MDFAGAQLLKRILQLLGENRIVTLVFPAHTTNLFQALDLIFFGAMKNNKDSLVREPEIASAHGQIWKLIRTSEQRKMSFTIQACSCKAELSSNT